MMVGLRAGPPWTAFSRGEARTASMAPNRIGAVGSFHGAAMVTPAPESPHRLVAQTQARYLIAIAENDDAKDPEAKVALRTAFDSAKLSGEVEV